ncbi:MAG: S8 family serine peptidase, partial [Chloroflexota bacterium]|nr:S8 family serine peptidase [Chloroflexota bacterium]
MAITPRFTTRLAALLAIPFLACAGVPTTPPSSVAPPASYIVQAPSTAAAQAAVAHAGGTVQAQLGIINSVSALLDGAAVAHLQHDAAIHLYADRTVQTSGHHDEDNDPKEAGTAGYALYPAAATGATAIQNQNISQNKITCSNVVVNVDTNHHENRPLRGWGVTVAVVDSGLIPMEKTNNWDYVDPATGGLWMENGGRCIGYRDFLPRTTANGNSGAAALNSIDQNGHGTHVVGTIADHHNMVMTTNTVASPVGVAPDVNLMVARVLDRNGAGTYGDVIAAIDYIVSMKTQLNIKVLNLSLYAPATGPYWSDPLDQAVMRAWQAGITVVAAAGNDGPGAGTITVPGNVPYVITAGAIKSGRYTDSGSDELATYSGRGPTESAFVKPDVLVPASRTIAPMPNGSLLAGQVAAGIMTTTDVLNYQMVKPIPAFHYYRLSGTSMAAAQISGIAALVLQANPTFTNNQVKGRIMATARPAVDALGLPVYSIWEQGAGLVNTQQAVLGTINSVANPGMDLATDLDPNGTTHYWGNTTWNSATSDPLGIGAIVREAGTSTSGLTNADSVGP